MKSRRTLAVQAALEVAGHTLPVVRWTGGPHGGPGEYEFTSQEQRTPYKLGRTSAMAIAAVPSARPAP